MARALVSGWQISSILRLQTGPFVTITSGLDQALTGQGNQRPNQVLADPFRPERSIDRYLNPAAFAQPAIGTYGNVGANNIVAPGSIQWDMGITRNFKVMERQSVQFRWEVFNVPNKVNAGTPTSALNNPNFGRILSASDPRIMQLALKYAF